MLPPFRTEVDEKVDVTFEDTRREVDEVVDVTFEDRRREVDEIVVSLRHAADDAAAGAAEGTTLLHATALTRRTVGLAPAHTNTTLQPGNCTGKCLPKQHQMPICRTIKMLTSKIAMLKL